MIAIAEETPTSQLEPATGEAPKGTKKATSAKRARNVAPAKAKSGKKATAAKKAPKGAQKGPAAPASAKAAKEKAGREGSKIATILDLLKRQGGATAKELLKVTGWQAHSLRGFISGTLGKKMGLAVNSTKGEDGERSYSIKA